MRKIKEINMNKQLIDNLLDEASIEDYMVEGAEIAINTLPLVLNKKRIEKDEEEIKKSSKRLAEINLILEILSSVGE